MGNTERQGLGEGGDSETGLRLNGEHNETGTGGKNTVRQDWG